MTVVNIFYMFNHFLFKTFGVYRWLHLIYIMFNMFDVVPYAHLIYIMFGMLDVDLYYVWQVWCGLNVQLIQLF